MAALPWIDWGGTGPTLHLAHANGFPAGSYRALAGLLAAGFHVVSLDLRPLWPGADPARLGSWRELADDLVRELRGRGLRGLVGAGHSLGAVCTAMAAVAAPELFSALVLIDPVLYAGGRSLLWALLGRVGLRGRIGLAPAARRRRALWPSRAAVRDAYAGKRLFAGLPAAALDDYLDAALEPAPGGEVALRYPPAWEARLFETAPADVWATVRALAAPVLAVRGETSTVFTAAAARRLLRERPGTRLVEVPGTGHLLPLERPEAVARAVLEFTGRA